MNIIEKPDDTIAKLVNLLMTFGDVEVLTGVNFRQGQGLDHIQQGENGSDKTALINIISGLLRPTAGSVEFKSKTIAPFSPYCVNRLRIGQTFQGLCLALQTMVMAEKIILEKRMFLCPSKKQRQRVDAILDKVSLTDKRNELQIPQRKLVAKLDINTASYCKIEKGEHHTHKGIFRLLPNPHTLIKQNFSPFGSPTKLQRWQQMKKKYLKSVENCTIKSKQMVMKYRIFIQIKGDGK